MTDQQDAVDLTGVLTAAVGMDTQPQPKANGTLDGIPVKSKNKKPLKKKGSFVADDPS